MKRGLHDGGHLELGAHGRVVGSEPVVAHNLLPRYERLLAVLLGEEKVTVGQQFVGTKGPLRCRDEGPCGGSMEGGIDRRALILRRWRHPHPPLSFPMSLAVSPLPSSPPPRASQCICRALSPLLLLLRALVEGEVDHDFLAIVARLENIFLRKGSCMMLVASSFAVGAI